jgi:hypothetical protein
MTARDIEWKSMETQCKNAHKTLTATEQTRPEDSGDGETRSA